jgi:small GTP-binding protein
MSIPFVPVAKTIKVCILGDIAVGKSSIIKRITKGKFEPYEVPTIGASYASKDYIINNEKIRFSIWDTAGMERYRSLIPMYVRDTQIIFLVIDGSNSSSFDTLNDWIKFINYENSEGKKILLINKSDKELLLSEDEIKNISLNYKFDKIVKCSALTNEGLNDILEESYSMIENYHVEAPTYLSIDSNLQKSNYYLQNCCKPS